MESGSSPFFSKYGLDGIDPADRQTPNLIEQGIISEATVRGQDPNAVANAIENNYDIDQVRAAVANVVGRVAITLGDEQMALESHAIRVPQDTAWMSYFMREQSERTQRLIDELIAPAKSDENKEPKYGVPVSQAKAKQVEAASGSNRNSFSLIV